MMKFLPLTAGSLSARRAWIEINPVTMRSVIGIWSLSARRAWIEIAKMPQSGNQPAVALRKESVDRNCAISGAFGLLPMSLSARRAWIEIIFHQRVL